jgi:hypothetical protein
MKKIILMLTVGASFILGSCASTNANTNIQKSQMASAKEIRGAWTLTNVNYEGLANKQVQGDKYVTETIANVFDTASPECYVGTTWNLVQNNKKGTYTFNNSNSGCPTGTADIIWDIKESGSTTYFTFKDVTGIKAKQNTAGYNLVVTYLNGTTMQLTQDVNVSGKIAKIIYTFQR